MKSEKLLLIDFGENKIFVPKSIFFFIFVKDLKLFFHENQFSDNFHVRSVVLTVQCYKFLDFK